MTLGELSDIMETSARRFSAKPEGRQRMRQPVRILIADDQVPTRDGLKTLLSLSPQVVIVGEAANGQQSVEMAEQCRPDVVLMDLRMPVMDGLEATRRIKNQWPDIRIVALTMYPTYQSKAVAAGADAFVLKGSPLNALQDAILGTTGRDSDQEA
jgi:DNA-binding NarL/FixJ family response regulator